MRKHAVLAVRAIRSPPKSGAVPVHFNVAAVLL
jgi:hypothetical protein